MLIQPAFPKIIDATSRRDYVSCPQKFFRSTIQKLALKELSTHLVAGGAYARGLEVTRKAYYGKGLPADDALNKGIEALWIAYGNHECPEKINKHPLRMVQALVDYFEEYPMKTDPMQPYRGADGEPAIEWTFALPIPGCLHPHTGELLMYAGRFDMIGEFCANLYVVDEKTTTSLGPSWPNQWKLRSQLTGYCWAAQQYGIPVAGAIIRGISILKTKFGHAQVLCQRPEWMISRWLLQLQVDVKNMIQDYKQNKWSFNLDEACNQYGECPFMTLCESGSPDKWIDQYYRIRDWDPLKKNPEEDEQAMLPPERAFHA